MENNTDYLLQLSTEAPKRPKIKIDDIEYELAVPEDFELGEFLQLAAIGSRAGKLMTAEDTNLNPEKVKELAETLDKLVKAVVRKLPVRVFNKLITTQKLAIVNVFSNAVGQKMSEGTTLQHGPKSFQDSQDSMVEAPKTG